MEDVFAATVLACRDAASDEGSRAWMKRNLVLGNLLCTSIPNFFIFIYIYIFPFVIHWKTYLGDFCICCTFFCFVFLGICCCYYWFLKACVALLYFFGRFMLLMSCVLFWVQPDCSLIQVFWIWSAFAIVPKCMVPELPHGSCVQHGRQRWRSIAICCLKNIWCKMASTELLRWQCTYCLVAK